MNLQKKIDSFFNGSPFAVVGASQDREKYGNKVLRAYLQKEFDVFPVNPNAELIEGVQTYARLKDLPKPVHGISIITPPAVTERIVQDAGEAGIKHIWMQPGAESESAIARCNKLGINVIGGDACLLVVVGFRETT